MNSHVSVTAPVAIPTPDGAPARAPSPAVRRRKRRRVRRLILLLILAAAIAGGGYYAWRTWFQPAAAATVQYVTSPVTIGSIEDAVAAVGTLAASASRTVESLLAGRIATITVAVGAVVAEGDVVATIDASSFESAVRIAEAQLTNLQASLADREAQLELQRQNLARQEGLLAANAAAEATVQTARAQVMSATASLESVRLQLLQQELALQNARDELEATTIRAPMAGTVVDLPTEVGQLVANGTAIMTLADLATMTVTAQVSEADVGRLSEGLSAYFTTLSGSSRRWTGSLREILPTPTVEGNVVMYSLLFDVDNADGTLMIGMSAEAFFVVAGANNVLRIPVAALQAAPRFGGPNAGAGATPNPAIAANGAGTLPAGAGAPANASAGAAPATQNLGGPGGAGGPGGLAGFNGQLPEGVDPAQLAERLAARQAAGGGGAGGVPFGQLRTANGAPGTGTATTTSYSVRVLKDDGTIEERPVEVGVRDRVNAEIRSGLVAGEQVVTAIADPNAPAAATQGNQNALANRGAALGGPPGGGGGGAVFIGAPF